MAAVTKNVTTTQILQILCNFISALDLDVNVNFAKIMVKQAPYIEVMY